MTRSEAAQVSRLIRMIENRDKSLTIGQWEDMLCRQAENVRRTQDQDSIENLRRKWMQNS